MRKEPSGSFFFVRYSLSWLAARTTIEVAPVLPEEPVTTAVTYSAPLLALSLLLAAVSGVLVVLAVARTRR